MRGGVPGFERIIEQRPNAGESRRCGSGIEPAKLRAQRRDTLAETVRLSRRTGEGDGNDQANAGDLEHRAVNVRRKSAIFVVVPNRLPLASAIRPPYGYWPSVPLKLTRVVGVPA